MKKKILFTTVIALALVCSFCLGAGAGASGTSQKITATIEPGIAVTVDGVPQQFLDVNGNRVYPIAYNGSTYLPLRAVCQDLAGYKVSWDQATRTAAVVTKSLDGVDLIDTYKAYDLSRGGGQKASQVQSSGNNTKEISGFTVNHWVTCFWKYYDNNGYYNCEGLPSYASFNVQGKYDTVTFKYYSEKNATLEVVGDNDSVLYKVDVPGGQIAQEVTVDLLKTNQLTFKFTCQVGGQVSMNAFIFDAYLK